MDLTDILANTGGLKSMARELGISEGQAQSGAEALLPAILGGFKKQAQDHPEGVTGLGGLLQQLGGGGLLDAVLSPQATPVEKGNDVLGQIFGSRDVSRTVADNAASRSGLDPALLKQMLPMLAMMVAGFMAKHHGAQAQAPQGGGGLGGLLGGLIGGRGQGGGGGLTDMLDMNGDGNALDDILKIARKGLR